MPRKNPGPETHQENGLKYLRIGEDCWGSYYEEGKIADFIKAYEHLALAYDELSYVKDRRGMRRAKKGLDAARKEIRLMYKLSKA